MKPSQINKVLDLAKTARSQKHMFNPLFVGAPGIAKSAVCQDWVREQQKSNPDFGFIDLRIAYTEPPDMIGFPSVTVKNGRSLTIHNLPEFWPTEGEGLLLLEEPNRGTTAVMNTLMQLLTDRKVHQHLLPEGWIIASCINPENDQHDVNTMDAALKNRFVIFDISYDKTDFMEYMRSANYVDSLIMFVETGTWDYLLPENIKLPGAKYVSPRSFSQANAVLHAGLEKLGKELEQDVLQSIFGLPVGKSFYHFKRNDLPVSYNELVHNTEAALDKLKKQSDPANYKNAHIAITVRNIVNDGVEITDELLKEVLLVLPTDQGMGLVRELDHNRKNSNQETYRRMITNYKEVHKKLKDTFSK